MEKKPFFVFKGAKRDIKRLNEKYQSKCIVASSDSRWMDEALTEQYCREVIGTFSFGTRRLLAWDAFRCHLTPPVNDILNRAKVDSVIIPGGCTKFIQAPDVSWNKPMKEYLRQICIYGVAPQYLLDLIKIKESSRYQLRSYRGILLMDNTYRTKKTLGDRAFENTAPKVWNRLPLEIRQCQSLNIFKVLLKTHLFKLAFY